MTKLDFTIPFSGFASTTFINCFTSVYMYLEDMRQEDKGVTRCSQWENGQCSSCGNCATKPHAMQERCFFLFDTICGHSSLRCAYDGVPGEMERLINADDFYDGGAADNIEFLFGFGGYDYQAVTDTAVFMERIAASIDRNKPVIAKLKGNSVPFAVITGYDGDEIICPDFRCAQKSPEPAIR